MKPNITDEIVDHFLNETNESGLFTAIEIEKLRILSSRNELEIKGAMESFINFTQLNDEDKDEDKRVDNK